MIWNSLEGIYDEYMRGIFNKSCRFFFKPTGYGRLKCARNCSHKAATNSPAVGGILSLYRVYAYTFVQVP